MNTLDTGLAVHIGPYFKKGNGIVVIYTLDQKIMATARYIDFGDKYWTVQVVVVEHGYGPLLYAIVASLAGKQGATLIPSNDQTHAAEAMWRGFERNPYVSIVNVPDEIRKGYYHDPKISVVGIKSNGSLDLTAALAEDQQMRQKMGEQLYKQMISKAVGDMNRNINDMY